jgi:hypothetical protein
MANPNMSVSPVPSYTVNPTDKSAVKAFNEAWSFIIKAKNCVNREQKLVYFMKAMAQAKLAKGCFIHTRSTIMSGSEIRIKEIAAHMLGEMFSIKEIERAFAKNGISVKVNDNMPSRFETYLFADVTIEGRK